MPSKRAECNGEQKQLDTEDILLCVNKWADAQADLKAIDDEIGQTLTLVRQLKRRQREASYKALTRWRALRRAQGYIVD